MSGLDLGPATVQLDSVAHDKGLKMVKADKTNAKKVTSVTLYHRGFKVVAS